MNKTGSGSARSDALVLFGVTGDLAHKMIFPGALRDGEARRSRRAGGRCRLLEVERWRNCANAPRTASRNSGSDR